MNYVILAVTFLGLALGSGLYQTLGRRDWRTHWERTYFQGMALLAAGVFIAIYHNL